MKCDQYPCTLKAGYTVSVFHKHETEKINCCMDHMLKLTTQFYKDGLGQTSFKVHIIKEVNQDEVIDERT